MGNIIVDREGELDLLNDALAKAQEGRGGAAVILGDPGTGKSFLLENFARRAERRIEDLVVAVGRGSELTERTSSYVPFREILEHLTGIAEHRGINVSATTDPLRLKKVRTDLLRQLLVGSSGLLGSIVQPPSLHLIQQLGFVGDELATWIKFLEQQQGPLRSTALTETGQVLWLLRDALLAVTRNTPLVIIVEDLHWADQASRALFGQLPSELPESRVLFIGTVRSGHIDEGSVARGILRAAAKVSNSAIIDLNESTKQRGELFCKLLSESYNIAADEEFVKGLFAKTGGNALFAKEIIEHLRTIGRLVARSDGILVPRQPLEWGEVPRRLSDAIEERLERVPREAMALLETASVAGDSFSAEVLAEVHEQTILRVLELLDDVLQHRHGLVEDVTAPSRGGEYLSAKERGRFRFPHDLYKQHIYKKRIGVARRKELHRRIAEAIEKLMPSQGGDAIAQLAEHYDEAGVPIKAAEYYCRAASRNWELAEFEAAARCALRGLKLAQLTEPQMDPVLLAKLYTTAASAKRTIGHFTEAGEIAESGLRAEWIVSGTRRKLMSELARSLYNRDTNMERATDLLREALSLSSEPENRLETADLYRQLGIVHQRSCRYDEAMSEYLQGLELAGTQPESLVKADLLNSMGVCFGLAGAFDVAAKCHIEALNLSERRGLFTRHTLFLNDLAGALRRLGEYDQATVVLGRAEELAKRQGKTGAWARALHEGATLFRILESELEAVEERLQAVWAFKESLGGQGPSLIRAALDLSVLRIISGRKSEAAAWLEEAERLGGNPSPLTGTSELVSSSLVRGMVELASNNLDEARDNFDVILTSKSNLARSACWAWLYLKFLASVGILCSGRVDESNHPETILKQALRQCDFPGVRREVLSLLQGLECASQKIDLRWAKDILNAQSERRCRLSHVLENAVTVLEKHLDGGKAGWDGWGEGGMGWVPGA